MNHNKISRRRLYFSAAHFSAGTDFCKQPSENLRRRTGNQLLVVQYTPQHWQSQWHTNQVPTACATLPKPQIRSRNFEIPKNYRRKDARNMRSCWKERFQRGIAASLLASDQWIVNRRCAAQSCDSFTLDIHVRDPGKAPSQYRTAAKAQ